MHLHGTFYTVESRGDAGRDTIYGADGRRLVTTELMEPGTTMAMRWVPDRVGKWLFHCHILAHVSGEMRLADMTPADREHARRTRKNMTSTARWRVWSSASPCRPAMKPPRPIWIPARRGD